MYYRKNNCLNDDSFIFAHNVELSGRKGPTKKLCYREECWRS